MTSRGGRPTGAIDKVLKNREFGLDEFAAVKSFLYGIDPLVATKRYLLTSGSPLNTEAAVKRLGRVMLLIAQRARSRSMDPNDLHAHTNAKGSAAVDRIANECLAAVNEIAKKRASERRTRISKTQAIAHEKGLRVVPDSKMPKPPAHLQTSRAFDDWYEDTYRPDELLDRLELITQFQEHLSAWYESQGIYYEPDYSELHGAMSEQVPMRATQIDADAPPIRYFQEESRKVAALYIEPLQWTVQHIPNAADDVSVWIGGSTVKALKDADVYTLSSLCDLIRQRGAAWWKNVPSLGPVRAKRVQDWLSEVGTQSLQINSNMFEPIQRRRLREVLQNERSRPALPALAALSLEPLAPYVNNDALNGRHGVFKSHNPNLLKADTDIDALVAALGKYADKRPTLAVYAREITRFCLWAYREQRLPMSSLGVNEARLFREFLDNIPNDWISDSPSPPPRNTAEWRPFRGQLDQASKRKALTAINAVLGQLMGAGYLTGNPMAGVLKHAGLARPQMDVSRSLSIEHWRFACHLLDAEIGAATSVQIEGEAFGISRLPGLRRIKAMMHLLFSTGMRRDELFKARLGHLKRVLVDGKTCHLLKVTGKRSKVREVLIEPEIMQLVLEHLADRPASFNDDLATQPGRDAVPFVSVLRDPLRTYLRKPEGDSDSELVESGMVVDQRELADTHGALSPDGMLSQIKAFFSKCASKCHEAGLDSSDFERATLHWLRHSFGHSMVDANVDVRVVQRALGHANINTTAHYSKADMVQMVRGLRQGAASIQRQTANSQLIEDRENVGPSISNTP